MAHFKKFVSFSLCFAIIFATFAFSLSLNVFGATNKLVHIFGTEVNFRSSMSSANNSNRICQIDNDYADLISESGNWLYINYNYKGTMTKGYVYKDPDWLRIVDFDPNARNTAFEQQISAFPDSYKPALRKLHALYPNWKFTAVNANITIKDFTALQLPKLAENPANETIRKKVSLSGHPVSWRNMGLGSYDWAKETWVDTDGGWTGASKEVVYYYLDPRNFLYPSGMFMFMKQTTNASQATVDDVQKIIDKFMYEYDAKGNKIGLKYPSFSDSEFGNNAYANVILEAGNKSGIDPCALAAIIWQEQGSGNGQLISGKHSDPNLKGYYNFFNITATGPSSSSVIINGLNYAKNMGWNTIPKSIIGGAKFVKDRYINIGQDTFFSQNNNIANMDVSHQYATNVADAYSKGYFFGTAYFNKFNYNLEFKIPVFKDMPSTNYARPVENNKLNNYYFDNISVSGLTPSFDRYTYSYSLRVSGDTALKYALPEKATLASAKSFSLKQGINTVALTVKSETGYTSDYTISVNADKACTLYITTDGKIPAGGNQPSTPSQPTTPTYKLGDVNGDGKISISDIGIIKWNLIDASKYPLSGNNKTAADVNKDGKISISDIGIIKWHLLDPKKYPL